MLRPCSDDGNALADRHAAWFRDRLAGVLTDALADVDPDAVRAVLRSVAGRYELELSEWEWRLVAGVPRGAATVDTAPGPFRHLCLAHCVGHEGTADLEPRVERALAQKILQGQCWETVADEQGFVSARECKRAVGRAIGALVETQGTTFARAQLEDTDG